MYGRNLYQADVLIDGEIVKTAHFGVTPSVAARAFQKWLDNENRDRIDKIKLLKFHTKSIEEETIK